MYECYYGFKEKPFQINPDPNFLYLSPNHDHALKYLEYGIERNVGIILLTGEVGSGKTTLIQYLRQQIGQNLELAVLSNTNLSADQLLAYILIELNVEPNANGKAHNLNLFKNYLKSLNNEERISFNYHLNGLNREETRNYIEYRLEKAGANRNPFTPEAVELIFQSTTGIPRSINILCDSALLYGFAEEVETVDADIVKSVLSDLNLQSFPQKETLEEPTRPEEQPAAVVQQAEISPTGNPGISNRDDLIKKVFVVIKKQLDKIDVKIELLRDEVLKKVNGSLTDERKRYEELLIEHTKIKSELERINFSEKNL
jgi:type II secretory pathway predicted ATPase ExeA